MGVNIENVMFVKKIIQPNYYINYMKSKGYNITFQNLQIFSNWNYENLQEHNIDSKLNYLESDIEMGKIISIFFNIDKYVGGYYIEKIKENIYMLDIWKELDKEIWINSDKKEDYQIYDVMTELSINQNENIIIGGIGEEIIINYYENIQDIISNSHGINKWILSKEESKFMNKYRIQKKGKINYIYSR